MLDHFHPKLGFSCSDCALIVTTCPSLQPTFASKVSFSNIRLRMHLTNQSPELFLRLSLLSWWLLFRCGNGQEIRMQVIILQLSSEQSHIINSFVMFTIIKMGQHQSHISFVLLLPANSTKAALANSRKAPSHSQRVGV